MSLYDVLPCPSPFKKGWRLWKIMASKKEKINFAPGEVPVPPEDRGPFRDASIIQQHDRNEHDRNAQQIQQHDRNAQQIQQHDRNAQQIQQHDILKGQKRRQTCKTPSPEREKGPKAPKISAHFMHALKNYTHYTSRLKKPYDEDQLISGAIYNLNVLYTAHHIMDNQDPILEKIIKIIKTIEKLLKKDN